MTPKEKALEYWHLEEHLHLPRTGSDATVGFEAGWDAAMEFIKEELPDTYQFITDYLEELKAR